MPDRHSPECDDEPIVPLQDPDHDLVEVLREAQFMLLAHPVAAQAAFAAFVAEGRRFAETPQGHRWKQRLVGSELIRKGRIVWEVTSMKLLEETPTRVLPSTYVDAFAKAAQHEHLESLLEKLFELGDTGAADDPR